MHRSNPSVLSYSKGCEPLTRFELPLGMQEAAHAVRLSIGQSEIVWRGDQLRRGFGEILI